jgi:murein DD-endopeptidase MepM/ murein hydrolase activator NlpD
VNIESIGQLLQRARAEHDRAGQDRAPEPGSERERLLRAAAEFESMLMLQMLKEMRKSGSWEDEEEQDGFGAQTLLETIDVELASHLSKVQGLGLGRQLLEVLGGRVSAAADDARPDVPEAAVTAAVASSDGVAVPGGDVTSGYGWRLDPLLGAPRFHRGIDIRAAYGQDVPAAAPGRVVSAGTEGGYGETVVIEHAGGLRTRYAHLSSTQVAAGDEVREGQIVGRAGRSGRTTGTHLHFEVLTASGDPLNPEQFSRFKAEGVGAD